MKTAQERGQKTKEKMIQVAFDLFHKQGVNATSVDEVLEKSNTGKSQFYYYFKSKEGLVHAVLQFFYRMLKSSKGPVKTEINSWEDLEQWFGFFVHGQKAMNCERGCPLGTIGNELTNEDELIRQDIKLIFELTRNSLARFFSNLKAKGEISSEINPESLADFCFSIMQGGLSVSKINRDSTNFENSVYHALTYLKSLAVKPTK